MKMLTTCGVHFGLPALLENGMPSLHRRYGNEYGLVENGGGLQPQLLVITDDSAQFPPSGNAACGERLDFQRHHHAVDVRPVRYRRPEAFQ